MKRQFSLAVVASALACAFSYQNCTQVPPDSSTSDSLSSDTSTTAAAISLVQADTSVPIGSAVTLTASGGTSPYTYSLYSGAGSINNGVFTGTVAGTVIIRVQDTAGASGYFNLTVTDTSTSTTTATPTPTPTATGTATPIYRFYLQPKHFFTANSSEGTNAGYQSEGTPFYVLPYGTATQPLYRCYWAAQNSHFVSVDSACSGSTNEGTLGYIFNTQVPNSVPLYSFYSGATADFLATTAYAEGADAGYERQGSLGFVYTSPP